MKDDEAAFDPTQSCKEAKERYNNCFNKWYREHFMQGKIAEFCQPEWNVYERCLESVLKRKKLEMLLEKEQELLRAVQDSEPGPGVKK